MDLAMRRFGRLDVLASIAGVAVNAPLESGELADWNRMIDVNLRGVLHGITAALPVFRQQGSGHFITVASTAAYKWVPGQAVYAATKSAVRALCEVMRQELAPGGLRCTLISPGFTDTDFISSTRDPDELASLTARRDAMAMPPQAVAETIAFAIASQTQSTSAKSSCGRPSSPDASARSGFDFPLIRHDRALAASPSTHKSPGSAPSRVTPSRLGRSTRSADLARRP